MSACCCCFPGPYNFPLMKSMGKSITPEFCRLVAVSRFSVLNTEIAPKENIPARLVCQHLDSCRETFSVQIADQTCALLCPYRFDEGMVWQELFVKFNYDIWKRERNLRRAPCAVPKEALIGQVIYRSR